MIQEEIKDQQKKMEGKSFQEKFQYFWYYYKVHVFAVLFTILVIVLFANAIMKDSKEPSIYVALINSALTAEADTPLLEEYVTLRGIELSLYYLFNYLNYSSSAATQRTVRRSTTVPHLARDASLAL